MAQIIVLIVAVALIAGIVWWFFGKHEQSSEQAAVANDQQTATVFVQSIRISQFSVNVNFDGAALFRGQHNDGRNQNRKHHRDRNEIADVKRFFGFEIAFFHLFEYESSFSSKLSTLKVSNVLSA